MTKIKLFKIVKEVENHYFGEKKNKAKPGWEEDWTLYPSLFLRRNLHYISSLIPLSGEWAK